MQQEASSVMVAAVKGAWEHNIRSYYITNPAIIPGNTKAPPTVSVNQEMTETSSLLMHLLFT
jgi:hypothetical protein